MADIVELQLDDSLPAKKFRLLELGTEGGQLQMQAVKDMFSLSAVEFNGVVANTDANGLSVDVFKPGQVIKVSGTPAEVKRVSDNASAEASKLAGSPGSPPQHALGSLALGSASVLLQDRFPNVAVQYNISSTLPGISSVGAAHQALLPEGPVMDDEVLEYVTRTLLSPALRYAAMASLGLEAGLVHMMMQVVMQLSTLCSISYSTGERLADTASSLQRTGAQWVVATEKWIHVPGGFRGRIEIQFTRETEQGNVVHIGAMEVGRGLIGKDLAEKVEQCQKEAMAMWMHNAVVAGKYETTFVILTDGQSLMRIEYEGHNAPGFAHKPYYTRMPVAEVFGEFRCTPGAMLFESAPDAKPASTTATGIQLLMGAFVKDAMPSLQELKERQEQADRVQQTRIDDFVELAMALQKASAQVVQERESKRQRLSQDSALAIAKGG